MAERPDLDAFADKLRAGYTLPIHDARALYTYCRELEAENKRLRDRCAELADEFQMQTREQMLQREAGRQP